MAESSSTIKLYSPLAGVFSVILNRLPVVTLLSSAISKVFSSLLSTLSTFAAILTVTACSSDNTPGTSTLVPSESIAVSTV